MKLKQGTIAGAAYIFRNRKGLEKQFKIGVRYSSVTFLGKAVILNLGWWILAVYSHEIKTPKQAYKCWKYDLTRWIQKTKQRAKHWYRYNFEKEIIYYSVTSMDCDLCEATNFGTKSSYKEYHDWMNDSDAWDWVEGRTSVQLHTKDEWEEYNEQPRRTRDYIMEAFEDGRGSHVTI